MEDTAIDKKRSHLDFELSDSEDEVSDSDECIVASRPELGQAMVTVDGEESWVFLFRKKQESEMAVGAVERNRALSKTRGDEQNGGGISNDVVKLNPLF